MNVKKLFLFLSLTISVFACNKDRITGNGNVISQERNATGFTGVVVNGSTKAFINLDTGFSVTVKGYENLLPYLETDVVNGALQVGFKNDVNVSNDNTEVYLTLPALDYVQTNGSGDMKIDGEVSGSDHLKASINGSANISVERGSANEFEGEVSGSGNILALGFQSKEAHAKISGEGNIEISVSDKLDVIISGTGSVYYHGTPIITTSISGTGQVIPK
jgi:hypothetical protein